MERRWIPRPKPSKIYLTKSESNIKKLIAIGESNINLTSIRK